MINLLCVLLLVGYIFYLQYKLSLLKYDNKLLEEACFNNIPKLVSGAIKKATLTSTDEMKEVKNERNI